MDLGPHDQAFPIRNSNGTQVLVSREHPHALGTIVGSVVSKSATQIRVAFDKKEPILQEGGWR
jgi:hypothetical protein